MKRRFEYASESLQGSQPFKHQVGVIDSKINRAFTLKDASQNQPVSQQASNANETDIPPDGP